MQRFNAPHKESSLFADHFGLELEFAIDVAVFGQYFNDGRGRLRLHRPLGHIRRYKHGLVCEFDRLVATRYSKVELAVALGKYGIGSFQVFDTIRRTWRYTVTLVAQLHVDFVQISIFEHKLRVVIDVCVVYAAILATVEVVHVVLFDTNSYGHFKLAGGRLIQATLYDFHGAVCCGQFFPAEIDETSKAGELTGQ